MMLQRQQQPQAATFGDVISRPGPPPSPPPPSSLKNNNSNGKAAAASSSIGNVENSNPNQHPSQSKQQQQQQQQLTPNPKRHKRSPLSPSPATTTTSSSLSSTNSSSRLPVGAAAVVAVAVLPRNTSSQPRPQVLPSLPSQTTLVQVSAPSAAATTMMPTTSSIPMKATATTATIGTTTISTTASADEANEQEEISSTIHTNLLPFAYPTNVAIPSRSTITALYEEAILMEQDDDEDDVDDDITKNDQLFLQPAGILSCQDVLLPALAIEEDYALKQIQRKVQRDIPHHKRFVQECRCHVYQSVEYVRTIMKESSLIRWTNHQQKLYEQYQQNLKVQQIRMETERQQHYTVRELQRSTQLRNKQRQYYKNQELWREVVSLLTAVSQLEKEEKLWKQVSNDLDIMEMEQQQHEKVKVLVEEPTSTTTNKDKDQQNGEAAAPSSSSLVDTAMEVAIPHQQHHHHPLQTKLEESIENISISSARIQQGLLDILSTMDTTDQLRRDLYKFYKNDFQFHGYLGITKMSGNGGGGGPKAMIQFLSQTQEEDEHEDVSYEEDEEVGDEINKMSSSSSSPKRPTAIGTFTGDTQELTPKTLIRRFLS